MSVPERKIIGVFREAPFAPLLFKEDSRILEESARRLTERGLPTELVTIDALRAGDFRPMGLLNMCEGSDSLTLLEKIEGPQCPVFNRPGAVRNCYRIRMISMLSEHALPFAKSVIVRLEGRPPEELSGGLNPRQPMWLKRGDVHCTQPGDVRRVANLWELEAGLRELQARGIPHAVVQEHIEGDLVKFYAVRRRNFFRCYVQGPEGTKKPYPHDPTRLSALAARSADVLGLDIYGGDFVLTPRGPFMIDINAWPSFAPCMEAAAGEIAAHVAESLNARINR